MFRDVRDVPAAWSCCRKLSEMCDSPIMAGPGPMASLAALAMVGGARLSHRAFFLSPAESGSGGVRVRLRTAARARGLAVRVSSFKVVYLAGLSL
jgi:hypothetical protein